MRIDSHQHFWRFDQDAYPWIAAGMTVLRRDYLPGDLAPLLAATGVDRTIAVQAQQTVDETRWLLSLADRHPSVCGVVGWAPLVDARVDDVLGELSGHPRLRGIRHILHDEADDRYMLRDDFNRGVARLRHYGLVYDVLILAKHLPWTLDFIDRHPNQPFVVDHIAKPVIAAARFDADWKRGLEALAERPHVTCKLSGVVTEVRDGSWTPSLIAPYMETALEAFGTGRLMFGTDWPVCLLRCGYADWVECVGSFISTLSAAEQAAIMGENAGRVYGIGSVS